MVDFNKLNNYGKTTFIFHYVSILIALIGIWGNLLTFIVFSRKKFQNVSFSFYMRVKMFADTIILLNSFKHFWAFIFDVYFVYTADIVCKLSEYVIYVCGTSSFGILAMISFDRLITIVYPQKFSFIRKAYFQILALVVIFAINISIYMPMAIFSELKIANTTGINNSIELVKNCIITDLGVAQYLQMAGLIEAIIMLCVINNILTIAIITFIFKSRKKFASSNLNNNKNNNNNSTAVRDRKFAINSVVLNLMYFLCKLPLLIILTLSTFNLLKLEQIGMLFTIGVAIYTIENACSFFINIFVNSLFYEEIAIMFNIRMSNKIGTSSVGSTLNTTK